MRVLVKSVGPGRVAVFLIGAFSLLALGQSSPVGNTSFRADTTLVLIPVSVSDSSNRFVLGLEKKNFRLFEGDAEQTISHFSGEDAPLSVGLLVDTSGSMGGKLETSREAVVQFLKTMNAEDEAFLVEFNDQAELTQAFTHDPGEIIKSLRLATSRGLTALLDAVHMALQEMQKAKNPRKAIVIISDGGDNNSRYTAKDIEDLVREADVQIYAMGVFEPFLSLGLTPAELGGPRLLSEISEQTGGRALTAVASSDLPKIAAKIAIELRNQYVLAYTPTNQDRDGKYRQVQIKLVQPPALPPLKARWRLGYYAPSQ